MPDGIVTEPELWKEALSPTESCLTLEELSRLSNHSLSRLSAAGTHAASCARCQTELGMLKEFQSTSTHPDEAAAVSWVTAELERRLGRIRVARPGSDSAPDPAGGDWWRRFLLPRPIRAAAFAFAALLAFIAVTLSLRSLQAPELASELPRGPEVMRSEELMVIGPSGDLKRAPAELRWQPIQGAARYRVKVMEVDRAELWQAESTGTSMGLPAAVRAKMVPGKTLLWQVTAIEPGGKSIAASQAVRFRLVVDPSSSKE